MQKQIVGLTLAILFAGSTLAGAQHAVPRGGGGSSSGGSSSGGSSSGGSSSGGSSTGGGSHSSGRSSGGGDHVAVPRHPPSSTSSGRRGGNDSGSSGRTTSRSPQARSGSGSGVADAPGSSISSRSQGDRPVVGYAVPRGTVRPPVRPGGDYWYHPGRWPGWYYNPWGWGTWGLGYFYDPFWWGHGYGYGYSPYGYGGSWGGYGGSYGGSYSASSDSQDDEARGAIRLKVKPREARVSVDGVFAGTVDDFDGNFQKLKLDPGKHAVELQAPGYEKLSLDVLIVEGQTITYKGKLNKQ
jgi:PEGA domain